MQMTIFCDSGIPAIKMNFIFVSKKMMRDHYIQLAAFNVWANKRICDFIAANLTSEQIEKVLVSSFPSVRKTINHICDAEAIWLERLRGNLMNDWSEHRGESFNEELTAFLEKSIALLEFLKAKNEAFISGNISYVHRSGIHYNEPASEILTHIINHSTFHRGQLIMMFRQLGFTEGIPKTDFIAYAREIAAVKAP